MKLAYYPGCSGHGTSKEYESSTRAVCRALGLEFAEIEDWSCCGSTPAHAMDTVLSGALAARNFKQIALTGAEGVLTPVRAAWPTSSWPATVCRMPRSRPEWTRCWIPPRSKMRRPCPKRIPYCRSFWSRSAGSHQGPRDAPAGGRENRHLLRVPDEPPRRRDAV